MADPRFIKPGFEQAVSHTIEEMGELLAALGKMQRHGPLSVNPLLPVEQQETNIAWVWREVEDLERCIERLAKEIRKHPQFGFLPWNPGAPPGSPTIEEMK